MGQMEFAGVPTGKNGKTVLPGEHSFRFRLFSRINFV